jgi:hypothetical protein
MEVTFGGEFYSPDEPIEDVDAAANAEISVDGPEQIRSKRRIEP